MSGGPGALEAVEERIDDLAVALQREDECHVDADAFGQALADRGEAPLGRGDLDEEVRPVHEPPERARLGDGPLGIPGDSWVDLDRDPTVDAVAGVEAGAQHVAARAD